MTWSRSMLAVLPAILVFVMGASNVSFMQTEGKSSKKTAPLPDLRVRGLLLEGKCQVRFEIENAGKGGVKPGDYAATVVVVKAGKVKLAVPLKAVDPGGSLQSPGGRAEYTTGIVLERRRSVTVAADGTDRVKESKEGNNGLTKSLTPACEKAAPAAAKKKTPPSPPMEPATGKVSPAAPLSVMQARKKSSALRLKIDRAYFARDGIHAVLVSTAPLPEKLRRNARLHFSMKGEEQVWPLSHVDPKRALQRKGGGKVDFATGIGIGEPRTVRFFLSGFGRGSTALLQVRLSPTREMKAFGRRIERVKKVPPGAPPEPVLFYEDYGIHIMSPASGDTVWLGEPMTVTYRFTERTDVGETRFTLTCDGREVAAAGRRDPANRPTGPRPGGGHSRSVHRLEWDLPGGLEGGETCIVEAVHGEARGLSSLFSIGSAAGFTTSTFVDLIDPDGAEVYEVGTVQTVKWRVYFGEGRSLGGWRFRVRRERDDLSHTYRLSGYAARPVRPGVIEFSWTWDTSEVPLGEDLRGRIEEIVPRGRDHEPLVDESDGTFAVRRRFSHDLAVTDLYVDGRDHVVAEIAEHEGPFVGNVRMLVEHGFFRGPRGPSSWEVISSSSPLVMLAILAGNTTLVDLGEAAIPRIDVGGTCGLWYRVVVDSEDWVYEDEWTNNEFTKEVSWRRDHGEVEVVDNRGGAWRVLSPPSDSIAFRYLDYVPRRYYGPSGTQQAQGLVRVYVKNCSRYPVRGDVTIVQTVNPGSALSRRTYTIESADRDLAPGEDHTFGAAAWFEAYDSIVEVTFGGAIAAWAPASSLTVTIDRRD